MNDDVDISLNNGDSFLNNSPGTIAFWYKMNDTSSNNCPLVVSHEYPENNFFQFKLDYSENKLVFHVRDDDNGRMVHLYAINQFEYNTWQFVSGTIDENFIKLFINGVLQDSVANLSPFDFISSENRILLAHSNRIAGGHYTIASLDEVSLWPTALTQSQIQENMLNGFFDNEEGLVGYWNFNEGSGTTLYDHSGNGNDGIINGGTIYSTDVPPLGCTDPEASNYDETANVDDGSCEYCPPDYMIVGWNCVYINDYNIHNYHHLH